MNRDEMVSVVESYINGLGSRDFSQVPFSEDLTLEDPLRQKVRGQEAIDFLSGLFPVMRGTEVIQHIVEGEYVASLFVLHTPNGKTYVFDKFRVADNELKEINPYFDPSVLNEAVASL